MCIPTQCIRIKKVIKKTVDVLKTELSRILAVELGSYWVLNFSKCSLAVKTKYDSKCIPDLNIFEDNLWHSVEFWSH